MTAYVRKILTVSKILYRFDGGPIDFEALDFSLSNPLVNPALVVTICLHLPVEPWLFFLLRYKTLYGSTAKFPPSSYIVYTTTRVISLFHRLAEQHRAQNSCDTNEHKTKFSWSPQTTIKPNKIMEI
jgi:hypothetical protein